MENAIDSTFAFAKPALVIGLMSGTSMDGIDLCAVELQLKSNKWTYRILASQTVRYAQSWIDTLNKAYFLPADQLDKLDREYGEFLGGVVRGFCESYTLNPDLVASHGHTIHHRPKEGYTRQVGNPASLAKVSQLPVVADFRSLDVRLGGQGAPLVPIIDRLLFGEYAQCLNLGGFANVSFEQNGERKAFDITAANALLNKLSMQIGLPYDDEGKLARKGVPIGELLQNLEQLPFYSTTGPKSLGREWLEKEVWPLFSQPSGSIEDLLATAVEHICKQLSLAVKAGPAGEILVTGGGAYNSFLISRFRENLPSTHSLVLPKGELVEFKEALAFALLGALRMRGEPNSLASVTGAIRDSCGGIYCKS